MTRRAAVLGHPVSHSLSPLLHRAGYHHLGLDWDYGVADVTADELPAFVASCGPEWVGLSLTMPLKTAVIPLLDSVDAPAAATGAANTLTFGTEGQRVGSNTDVGGFIGALHEHGLSRSLDSVTLLGGGATARSALLAVHELGAGHVDVVVRRQEGADRLVELAGTLGMTAAVATFDGDVLDLTAELVISTLPAGAADERLPRAPTSPGLLFDVVYDPWPTPLAAFWLAGGGTVLGGLDLLVHQALGQLRAMTGEDVPVHVLHDALARAGRR